MDLGAQPEMVWILLQGASKKAENQCFWVFEKDTHVFSKLLYPPRHGIFRNGTVSEVFSLEMLNFVPKRRHFGSTKRLLFSQKLAKIIPKRYSLGSFWGGPFQDLFLVVLLPQVNVQRLLWGHRSFTDWAQTLVALPLMGSGYVLVHSILWLISLETFLKWAVLFGFRQSTCVFMLVFSLHWWKHLLTVPTFEEGLLVTQNYKFSLILVFLFYVRHNCVFLIISFTTSLHWAIMDVQTQVLCPKMFPAGPVVRAFLTTGRAEPWIKGFPCFGVLPSTLMNMDILLVLYEFFRTVEIWLATKALIICLLKLPVMCDSYTGAWVWLIITLYFLRVITRISSSGCGGARFHRSSSSSSSTPSPLPTRRRRLIRRKPGKVKQCDRCCPCCPCCPHKRITTTKDSCCCDWSSMCYLCNFLKGAAFREVTFQFFKFVPGIHKVINSTIVIIHKVCYTPLHYGEVMVNAIVG